MRFVKFILFFSLLSKGRPVDAAEFFGLGDLAGGDVRSEAADVSSNGRVVVGSSRSANGREAFRWTRESGIVGLGDLPGGAFDSFGTAVSANGSVVVGGVTDAPGPPGSNLLGRKAFRWTAETGLVGITEGAWLVDDDEYAAAVSDDGAVVVGVKQYQFRYAFRWTAATGAVFLTSDLFGFTANGGSADGSVIVGEGYLVGAWVDARGKHFLPQWVERPYNGINAISPEGAAMGGYSARSVDKEATLFREDGKRFIPLGDLAGGVAHSEVLDLSDYGNVAVGFGHSTAGKEAFVWDEANGIRSLKRVLVDQFGLDLDGWVLREATGITPDGTVIVGTGFHDGVTEAFVAIIPEPSMLGLAAAGITLLARLRRASIHAG
jgi:probable HAF family extracellular repeat protein